MHSVQVTDPFNLYMVTFQVTFIMNNFTGYFSCFPQFKIKSPPKIFKFKQEEGMNVQTAGHSPP